MDNSSLSSVYISVIEDVVANVRKDFLTSGVGDAVLSELQALWVTKMMHCGAIPGNIMPPAASAGGATPPVHDLNAPYDYEATSHEYFTPTADMLYFPPTPLQTPIIKAPPLPGTDAAGMYNVPTWPSSDYAPSRPPTPAAVATPRPRNETGDEGDDDDEPPLNEDDDDDDESDDDDEPDTQHHLVLAQFGTVKRAKNRWKCTLKDGIMRLNDTDVLFNRASGEFEF